MDFGMFGKAYRKNRPCDVMQTKQSLCLVSENVSCAEANNALTKIINSPYIFTISRVNIILVLLFFHIVTALGYNQSLNDIALGSWFLRTQIHRQRHHFRCTDGKRLPTFRFFSFKHSQTISPQAHAQIYIHTNTTSREQPQGRVWTIITAVMSSATHCCRKI